jgi:DNA transposition AAA+ family ATPase
LLEKGLYYITNFSDEYKRVSIRNEIQKTQKEIIKDFKIQKEIIKDFKIQKEIIKDFKIQKEEKNIDGVIPFVILGVWSSWLGVLFWV